MQFENILKNLPERFFLVGVDQQGDFFDLEGSNLPIPNSKQIIQPTDEFLKILRWSQCKGVLFTQDWHDADWVERMPDGTPFDKHCEKDTEGAKIVVSYSFIPNPIPLYNLRKNVFDSWEEKDIEITAMDLVTKKSFVSTSRDKFFEDLIKDGMVDFVIMGVASDICVKFFIAGLFALAEKLSVEITVTVLDPFCKGLFREMDQVIAEDFAGKNINLIK